MPEPDQTFESPSKVFIDVESADLANSVSEVAENILTPTEIQTKVKNTLRKGKFNIPRFALKSDEDLHDRITKWFGQKRYVFVYCKGPSFTIGLWAEKSELLSIGRQ